MFFYDFPVCRLGIAEENGAVTNVVFDGGKKSDKAIADAVIAETPLIQKTAAQLAEYFDGKRTSFDVPIAPRGTPFQLSVWEALRAIPFGATRSYKEIAELIKNPLACRAVGMANNKNPIVIIIPCHRVIGHNGGLTGFGGGLPVKQFLLDLEKGTKGGS
jgi:methylated-DNA-[protein]-cysteine S-methyltransferase